MSPDKNISGFYFECINCKRQYDHSDVLYVCPECSASNVAHLPPKGILKTVYDYPAIAKTIHEPLSFLKKDLINLLPLKSSDSLPLLKVGNTPLYHIDAIGGTDLPFSVLLKDDAQNPTFSFKDRASALVSAYAKERGFKTIVAASTGNAGSSIAGICAAQGQKAVVMLPEKAPKAKLTQVAMYGARLIPVKGTYDEAFELSIAASKTFGWYNRNTAYNPITIEGKKTVAFELFRQMDGQLPDRIFVPVGDGVIISGVYKGFEDLLLLKLIEKMPLIVTVQSEGSDNLIRNLDRSQFEIKPSQTVADSISVDVPRNYYMARDFIKKYDGETITVSDHEILVASKCLAVNTGLFTEPASAAAFAGLLRFKNENRLPGGSRNVVLLTGSGLKDLESIMPRISIPEAIPPDIEVLKNQIYDKVSN